MPEPADFYGFTFEADYSLFFDEFEASPGVYVIYTTKVCLDIGVTANLKESIETHPNTREWIKLSEGDDIYVAFYFEEEALEQKEVERYLRDKMKPLMST